jgi:tetratricopeptide (TPR) repeat protein
MADGTGELTRTAAADLGESVKIAITGTYAADGAYQVTVRREFVGDVEMAMRGVLKSVPQHGRLEMAKAMAKEDGVGDKVTVKALTMADPYDLSQSMWVQYEAEHKYTSPIRRERWTYWLPSPHVLQLPRSDGDEPIQLGGPATIELTGRFVFPASLAITPPVGVSLDDESGRYESSYGAAAGVLTVRRRFEARVERVEQARVAALRALERSAKADRGQNFTIAAASAELLTTLEAADRASAGERALARGDLSQAVTDLRAAVAEKADHPRAWASLGRALHGLGRWDEAIEAYDRQIALDRYDEHAYRNRGLSQWQAGRLEAAEASMRGQIAVTPLNAAALTSLGAILIEDKREAEAIDPLTKAVSLAEKDPWAHLALGRALAATGKSADALASFERVVAVAPNPMMWNNAAWFMAEHGLALDKAYDYAQSAVAAAAAATLLAAVDKPAGPQLAATSSLAAYWDTLGWVQFKRERYDDALKYVLASWRVGQQAIVGEHLGRIYEKLGKPREAFTAYRTAMGLPRPPEFVGTRAGELARSLNPPPKSADSSTLGAQMRTVALTAFTPVPGIVEVMLVTDASGVITSTRSVSAGVADAAVRELTGVKLSIEPPDAVPFRLVARGAVSCRDGRAPCALVLYRPDEAMRRVASESRQQQP